MLISPNYSSHIFEGVDFLLSHLSKPNFPRTIATKLTEGKQRVVTSIEEALQYYKNANYMDCRLAAYPYTVNNKPQVITFVLLDFDLNNFKYSRQKLEQGLKKNLLSLKNDFKIQPTVIWSGNGYHVLIPIEPYPRPLESMSEFARFTEPSKKALRFLEKYLSKNKSDSVHSSTVSFGNCMLRVPGSFNSKHGDNIQIRLIHKWNGEKLNIKPLIGDLLAYLLDEESNNSHTKYYKHSGRYLLSKP